MDDDAGDWFSQADEPEPEPILLGALKEKRASQIAIEEALLASLSETSATTTEAAAPADRPVAEDEYLDPDKLLLFKHWIR